jgi:exosortase
LAAIVILIFTGDSWRLSGKMLAIVALLMGLFLAIYGRKSFKQSLFPLFFLFLMVPIPDSLVQQIVAALQRGSAEVVSLIFRISGTPFHRAGLTFILPKIGIEIASQCSGIRSSMALFISALMAAHLVLSKTSRQFIFVLAAVPMAMIKNAIRIATLSLLAIHVDTRFIWGSDLHRKGGIVFFLTTLLLMAPILWLLRRSEKS